MRATLLAAIAAVGLAGCVGGISSEGPLPPPDVDGNNGANPANADLTDAKKLFDDTVYPVLRAKCATGCHLDTGTSATATRFVANDKTKGWQTAINYIAVVGSFAPSAPILTKISGGHQGAHYVPDEITKITAWLNKELELRNGGEPEPAMLPPGEETRADASNRVVSQFMRCMTLTDFDAAQMANKWGNMQAQNQTCGSCHANGGFGMIMTEISQHFFNVLSTDRNYFLQYLTPDLLNGPAEAKIVINTASFMGVAQGQPPHLNHPKFNATNNQGMTALTTFYNKTMARIASNDCPAPPP